ncbi:MAG TPA: glycerol-3-phosphate acyltransferase [Verrucomicrobiae bacterium]|nr:glycerol-3-phosphate acyltransferase [Verrucomicrobiae bacterium]
MSFIQQIFGPSVPPAQISAVLSAGYLLGCLTLGYYLVRWQSGQDIRQAGSGSVGAKNVGRVLGVGGFILTLLADFAKGMLAVWLAAHYLADERLAALAMLAVVTGHIWPAQLGFHGGKGVATALGAMLVYDPRMALIFAGLAAGALILTRRGVLSGLAAFAFLPLAALFRDQGPFSVTPYSLLAGMILFAHRKNLAEEISHFASRRRVEPAEPDHS